MKILVAQEEAKFADPIANLQRLEKVAVAAAAFDVDIAVFPEMFLTGYNIGEHVAALAEPVGGAMEKAMAAIAAKTGVALVTGLPIRKDDKIYNAALAVDRTGEVAHHYCKMMLWGDEEKKAFVPGNAAGVATLAGHKVGLAICYDIEFPEIGRALARRQVSAILVPTAIMEPFREHALTLTRARALENGIPIVYANLAGQEGDLSYVGLSAVVGADGKDLVRGGVDPCQLVTDISPSVNRQMSAPFSSQLEDLDDQNGNV